MVEDTATTPIDGQSELGRTLQALQTQLLALSARLERLEAAVAAAAPTSAPALAAPSPAASAPGAPAPEPAEEQAQLGEEELLAISAAVAAYLGVRPSIRQIRLVASPAWALQGRISVQGSHRLND